MHILLFLTYYVTLFSNVYRLLSQIVYFYPGHRGRKYNLLKSPLYFERDARLTKVSFEGEGRSTVMDPA